MTRAFANGVRPPAKRGPEPCPAQQRSRNQIRVAQGWRFSRPAAFPPISERPQVWEKHPALRYGACCQMRRIVARRNESVLL